MKLASKNVRRNIRASVPTRAEIASSILVSASLFVGPSVLVSTTTHRQAAAPGGRGGGYRDWTRLTREIARVRSRTRRGQRVAPVRSQRRGEGATSLGQPASFRRSLRTPGRYYRRMTETPAVERGLAAAHAPNSSRLYSVFSTIQVWPKDRLRIPPAGWKCGKRLPV